VTASAQPPAEVRISVVVPVLNEAPTLEELHARLRQVLPAGAEILFVDDGSTDDSARIFHGLLERDPLARVVRLRRTFGKSLALAAGFRRARGRVLVTIDGDLQEDPADIPRLLALLDEGFDLVGAWRRRRQDPVLKVWGSRLFNGLVSLAGGKRFHDINCGLKAFRREVADDVVLAGGFHRFLPLLAHWKGYRVVEREVAHAPRRHGRSRYGGDKVPRGLLDLVVILFLLRHEGRPGRLFAALGTGLGAIGLAISAYLAYVRLRFGTIRSQFPLLSLGLVLMVVGVQLFSLGLFGELLAYHFRSRRPMEPVADELDAGPPGGGRRGEPT
jgi:glycosyltransferase involved in cell wall biosynthesis